MSLFLITVAIVGIALAAMSIGVIFGRQPIKGSCGGLSNIAGAECGICGAGAGDPCNKEAVDDGS
jgi:hypothetical protein